MKVKKFVSALSALTIAASAFAGMAVTASAEGENTVSLQPTADTVKGISRVSEAAPSIVYGAESSLIIGKATNMWTNGTPGLKYDAGSSDTNDYFMPLIKFDVSKYKGDIVDAEFKITATNSNVSNKRNITVYLGYCDVTDWTEAMSGGEISINYRSSADTLQIHPFNSATDLLATTVPYDTTGRYSFKSDALASYLNNDSDGIVTLFMYTTQTNEVSFNSRENADTTTRPELILTLASDLTTSYTVNYVDTEGNQLKEPITSRTGDDGTTVEATEEDINDFELNGAMYSINWEKSTYSIVLDKDAESNEINLVFDKHDAVNIPIKAKAGDLTIAEYETSSFVDYPYSFSPHAYVLYNGDYYKYNSLGADGVVNKITGISEKNTEIDIEYTLVPDIVFYAEVDPGKYEGHAPGFTGEHDKASGGSHAGSVYGAAGSMLYIDNINIAQPGIYKVTAYTPGMPGSGTRSFYLAFDSKDANDRFATLTSDGGTAVVETEVELEKGVHRLNLITNGANSCYADYVVIEKVTTLPVVSAAQEGNDFTTDVEETKDNASLWKLQVTAGTNAIKSVGVEVKSGTAVGQSDKTIESTTVISGEGSAEFAIVVNKHADEITEINALLDGTSYNAYTKSVE